MTLRPPRDDEFDAMLELMNAHQLAAFGEADYTADDLRTWLTTPYVVIDRDIRVLERDGRLIGYADADPTRDDPPLWWCDVKVHPDVDAGPVVAELVAWLDERAATGGCACGRRRPTGGSSTPSRALGFDAGPPLLPDGDRPRPTPTREPLWPDGISLRTATADDHRPVHAAAVEVWQDTNDPLDETFEEWAHWHVERDSYDPSLWFLAFAGDELAGFSLCREDPVDLECGLRRNCSACGGRGGGRVSARRCSLHSFAEFRKRGYARGTLGVDASSVDRRDPALRAGRHARLPRHRLPRAARPRVGSPA